VITDMLSVIEQIKERTRLPYRNTCRALRLPYSNFMRWHVRQRKRTVMVHQPGPPKIKPLDLSSFRQDIAGLQFGSRRVQGTGMVYACHASSISRRDLQSLVNMARHDLNAQHRQNLRRIEWLVPGAVWSMDPSEYEQRDVAGHKVFLNQLQDLASRYKFPPMAGSCPCGEEIAGYLAEIIGRFGSPLFLKRDNGGNLNHPAVDDLLSQRMIIPLNSPVHYPPYNGAIEHAQDELKDGLRLKLRPISCCPSEHVEAYAGLVEHDLNHKPRPCLKGKNACQVFFSNRRGFSKKERRDTFDWIADLQNDILSCSDVQPDAAWRIASEIWLRKNGFITVTVNGKVLPDFF
jgi:hypothetical protein